MAFLRHGCRVLSVCPPHHPLHFVGGISESYLYRSIDSLRSLKAAVVSANPDLIVPCDDGVVWQLHALHRSTPELRSLIETSLGEAGAYATIRSRNDFLQMASRLGIRTPKTRSVAKIGDLSTWEFDDAAVLKLDGTCGGNGVTIVESRSEAEAEFNKMLKPDGIGFALKRCLVNREPLALWTWYGRFPRGITLQEFVHGSPANAMVACWKGEVLGIVVAQVLATQGSIGAATVIQLIQNEEIERAARLIVGELKLSGFHGLDFMMEAATGKAYLIELNPRCTQLGHLSLPMQGDLAGTLIAKLTGNQMEAPENFIKEDTVAFFPQTFKWNPKSSHLRSGFNDVPWEEPTLLKELLREDWPERQWISKVYHSMRGQKRVS